MATLQELIREHGLGKWLAPAHTKDQRKFKPMFLNEDQDRYIGENYNGISDSYKVDEQAQFVLWEESKPSKQVTFFEVVVDGVENGYLDWWSQARLDKPCMPAVYKTGASKVVEVPWGTK